MLQWLSKTSPFWTASCGIMVGSRLRVIWTDFQSGAEIHNADWIALAVYLCGMALAMGTAQAATERAYSA